MQRLYKSDMSTTDLIDLIDNRNIELYNIT